MRRRLLKVKTIGVLAVILVLFMAVGVAEEEKTDASGQWKYVLEDGCATITGYMMEPVGDLVIPDVLDGYAVTSVGSEAFKGCGSLTSVVIPNRVESIGDWAFFQCGNLASIAIPNSVKSIGNWAFGDCESLTSVTLPDSVTSIGENPFSGCPLEYISVSANNPAYESIEGVLFDKQQKMLVTYPYTREGTYSIPEGVTLIGNSAFIGCSGLTNVIIPVGVTNIGDQAFAFCSNLASVTIPDSVKRIGNIAFAYCNNLTSVSIPDSVTIIGDCAFIWCSNLASVTIPSSANHIGTSAFFGCSGLTSVTIPDSVTSIGNSAFGDCGDITLIVEEGSSAEQYAKENNIPYALATE